MRLVRAGLTLSLAVATLAACGQVEPVTLAVSMPDCVATVPSAMREGDASVSLTLNGLSDSGVALVRLDGERTHDDLTAHFERNNRWSSRPPWAVVVVELRLDAGQGLDGVEETVTLDEGSYAMVCIDHPYDAAEATARVAAPMEVKA